MKKIVVGLMTGAMVFAFAGAAVAADPTGFGPTSYTKVQGTVNLSGNGDYKEYVQGQAVKDASGNDIIYNDTTNTSVHPQGTWNSPYTVGVDGYNYNDPQDYVRTGDQVDRNGTPGVLDDDPYNNVYTAGPHGGHLTTTHKCRECHAVHRAAGKFKLTRADTRFEACDWCHGTGAGSGFNIEMDNDDLYTREYNVGHSMGFGIDTGKFKAPDDTYPAYTPKYNQGGFSCFDCHSPHANPQRLLGFNDKGEPVGLAHNPSDPTKPNKVYGIVNPGHGAVSGQLDGFLDCQNCHKVDPTDTSKDLPRLPLYLSGSW
ncbi:MAG TPA: hypothetical protein VE439_00460, partial [Anaerolineae bacterium]|nr:hypothetical protein [Anaerolineae bacterium]